MDAAQRLVMQISGQQRETCDISNLTMAIKCGGSDTTSGMASNCVIGYVADKLVDLGATVVFGETTEFLGGEHILANRAVGGPDGPVAKKIYEIVERMENRAKAIGEDMRGGQPTPGNIAGGLSSIEEKSLGAIVKSGHRPIQGVLEYTDRITDQKGLWIKDNPGPRARDSDRYGRNGRAGPDVLDRPRRTAGLLLDAGYQNLRQPDHLRAHVARYGPERGPHHHGREGPSSRSAKRRLRCF